MNNRLRKVCMLLSFVTIPLLTGAENGPDKVDGAAGATQQKDTTKRILFIGDSITDGNWGGGNGPSSKRNRWDQNHLFGSGYMYLCAAHFMGSFPERHYLFYNRGISGNTLEALEQRWKEDVLEIKPDVLSILIGTNDIAYYLRNTEKPFDFEGWGKRYRSLLDQSLAQNPSLKIVLCAPFVAKVGEKVSDQQARLVRQCATVVEKIAWEYKVTYLPYNTLFDTIIQKNKDIPASYWVWDGIHPTAAGHKLMADLWIDKMNRIMKKL